VETTAGTGSALGSTLEELARLRDLIGAGARHRIGFCADTCHLYSAGYDLVGDYDGVWSRWESVSSGGAPLPPPQRLQDPSAPAATGTS
jgi:deoxyribonuclease-4